jgi:hypothetical protein
MRLKGGSYMAKQRKIIVRGKPRTDIDPAVLVQVLLAIAAEWERPHGRSNESPDAFDAAIEDRQGHVG